MAVTRSDRTTRQVGFPSALLEPAEMTRADTLASAVLPSTALMERAGEAVAKAVIRIAGEATRVQILCGPGNNGGDGFVAARLLANAGCHVKIASLVARDTLKADAAWASSLWTGAVTRPEDIDFDKVDVIVDALFGAGLSRDIDGQAKTLIERVNGWAKASGGPVLSVDMPSGVDGTSGAIRGIAVEATDSITFFRLKPGHVLMPGRVYCGALALADIGIAETVLVEIAPKTSLNAPALWMESYPRPTLAGHKYARGHAVVVSGPVAQTGAARLCARGALRAGAGLVTIATPADALAVHATALTAVMTRVADDAAGLAALLVDKRKNAVVLGPGLGVGETTRAKVLAVLRVAQTDSETPRAIVLDADALVSFSDDPTTLFDAIKSSGHAVVLTPHDGEFAKLFGPMFDISEPKPHRTREAAAVSGAVVVLKGPDTVVATPDGRASIAASDAPWLATAGSGDVLAGMICGLLAQGMPSFEAASAAVWVHAEAARLFGPGLISEDIPELVPRVLRQLFET